MPYIRMYLRTCLHTVSMCPKRIAVQCVCLLFGNYILVCSNMMHIFIHTYMFTYVHACTYSTYVHTYSTYVHTYNTYIQYTHTYVHTYSTYVHTYSTYIRTYIQYIHTYIHTYIQYIRTYSTYVHTYMCVWDPCVLCLYVYIG